MAWKLS